MILHCWGLQSGFVFLPVTFCQCSFSLVLRIVACHLLFTSSTLISWQCLTLVQMLLQCKISLCDIYIALLVTVCIWLLYEHNFAESNLISFKFKNPILTNGRKSSSTLYLTLLMGHLGKSGQKKPLHFCFLSYPGQVWGLFLKKHIKPLSLMMCPVLLGYLQNVGKPHGH